MNDQQVAKGLGIFSIGLGLAELAAPRWLGQQTGIGDRSALIRTLGAREIAAGIGVLSQERPAPGLWARVVGDVIDLAVLGVAAARSARKGRVALSIGLVLGVSLLDLVYARRLQNA